MIPLPTPGNDVLPKGTFLITDNLVTALSKIPDTFTANGRPVAFPTREGPWLFLPNGSCLTVREDQAGERLTAIIRGDPAAVEKDLPIILQHLD